MPPEFTVYIEKWGETPTPVAFTRDQSRNRQTLVYVMDAASASNRAGLRFTAAEINYAANEQGGLGTLEFTVDGLDPNQVNRIIKSGVVSVDGGYVGGDGPPITTLFYGHLKTVKLGLSRGRLQWSFSAIGSSPELRELRPELSGEKTILIADAANLIAGLTGFTLVKPLPPAAHGDFTNYKRPVGAPTTAVAPAFAMTTLPVHATVAEHLTYLASEMRRAVREATHTERDIWWMHDQANPHKIQFVDMTGGQPQTEDTVTINLDDPHIFSAGMTIEAFGTPETVPDEGEEGEGEGGEGDEVEVVAASPSTQTESVFDVAMRFDGRIRLGSLGICESSLIGEVRAYVQHVKHNLVDWRTEWGGPVVTSIVRPIEEDAVVLA